MFRCFLLAPSAPAVGVVVPRELFFLSHLNVSGVEFPQDLAHCCRFGYEKFLVERCGCALKSDDKVALFRRLHDRSVVLRASMSHARLLDWAHLSLHGATVDSPLDHR